MKRPVNSCAAIRRGRNPACGESLGYLVLQAGSSYKSKMQTFDLGVPRRTRSRRRASGGDTAKYARGFGLEAKSLRDCDTDGLGPEPGHSFVSGCQFFFAPMLRHNLDDSISRALSLTPGEGAMSHRRCAGQRSIPQDTDNLRTKS